MEDVGRRRGRCKRRPRVCLEDVDLRKKNFFKLIIFINGSTSSTEMRGRSAHLPGRLPTSSMKTQGVCHTCGRCAERFYLSGAAVSQAIPSPISTGPAVPKALGMMSPLVQSLNSLHALHVAGALTAEEFAAAKAQLLL